MQLVYTNQYDSFIEYVHNHCVSTTVIALIQMLHRCSVMKNV